ncbi:MAG TPA: two-component sensor histidine kinase, partial [Noviherbaspirillum sp.]|nr:two-component sensor histidine kinase [Noviherbaspirillum sp.]
MRSIRRTLLLWLYAGLSLGIAAAAAVLYFQARAETNRILDFQMQQLAWSLPGQPFAPITPERRTLPALPEGAILIQIWDRNGVRIYYSH